MSGEVCLLRSARLLRRRMVEWFRYRKEIREAYQWYRESDLNGWTTDENGNAPQPHQNGDKK